MYFLDGYKILNRIDSNSNFILYHATREQDNLSVIIKVLPENRALADREKRLRNDYESRKILNSNSIIGVYDLHESGNALSLTMEDIKGVSLRKYLAESNPLQEELLRISIAATLCLEEIHRHGLIHRDIKPSNFIYNPSSGLLKLNDFGLALQEEEVSLNSFGKTIEGTPLYISPEQTGRINRKLDYRTDFYSLGVTLYEIFTGVPPFPGEDILELIHSHIAREPLPPESKIANIPPGLSEVILKLLEKTPEKRYRSARGIRFDLEEILEQVRVAPESSKKFVPGLRDIQDKFLLPDKLYGRENDLNKLRAAWKRCVAGGTELLMITGAPGVGKSSLVRALANSDDEVNHIFLYGKYEQSNRNIAYSALSQAFQGLTKRILSESESVLREWREALKIALGPNGKLLTDLIPELELIAGEQPSLEKIGPEESHNRHNLVFSNFVRLFAQKKHPLIIYLDDLQWADASSPPLLELLLTDPELNHFLLIGSYRANEVDKSHPLSKHLERLTSTEIRINHINLEPLSKEHLELMIKENLPGDEKQGKELARLIFQKAGGNPFFVKKLLRTLYQEGLLYFSRPKNAWDWKLESLKKVNISENVVEFMLGILKKLPEPTREALKYGACIGARFELNFLASIMGLKPGNLYNALTLAVRNEIITIEKESYPRFLSGAGKPISPKMREQNEAPESQRTFFRFQHDRLEQASSALMTAEERSRVHLKIGRNLIRSQSNEKQKENVFELVFYLNSAWELIYDPEEKKRLARLNFVAAERARVSGAFVRSLEYLKTSLQILKEACGGNESIWEHEHELALELHVNTAEISFLAGDFDEMESSGNIVLARSLSPEERTRVYEARIRAFISSAKYQESIDTALEAFKELGLNFPARPSENEIQTALETVKTTVAGRSIKELSEIPQSNDNRLNAVLRIISSIFPSVYAVAPSLLPLVACKGVELSLTKGFHILSPEALAMYGVVLIKIKRDIETAYNFGELALLTAEKFENKEAKARGMFPVHYLLKHWKEPLSVTLEPFLEAHRLGKEWGRYEVTAVTGHAYCRHSFIQGKNLATLSEDLKKYSLYIKRIKQRVFLDYNKIYLQAVLNLLGKVENPQRLLGEAFNEETDLTGYIQANNKAMLIQAYYLKLLLGYYFDDFQNAPLNIQLAEENLTGATATAVEPQVVFFTALTRIVLLERKSVPRKELNEPELKEINESVEQFKTWASFAPQNYSHKLKILEAEIHKLFGEVEPALEKYHQAMALAHQNEYTGDEALANELCGKFFSGNKMNKAAGGYILAAERLYKKWGAQALVERLRIKYPDLSNLPSIPSGRSSSSSSTTESRGGLDVSSMFKATQAISGEINLENLLRRLMRLIIEAAGAQKGYLILKSGADFFVEARANAKSDQFEIEVLQSLPLEECADISSATVRYVVRTGEQITFQNAELETERANTFFDEPYLKKNHTKSLLCIPLRYKNVTSGALYLENNLVNAAFTAEEIEVLQILISQASISLENARLYRDMEKSQDELRAYNRELESFAYSIAHDLRTPLRGIGGFSQILRDNYREVLDARGLDYLERITRGALHMGRLMDALSVMIHISRKELNPSLVDPAEICQKIIEGEKQKYPGREIKFRSAKVPSINADPELLYIALYNLLENSIKFSREIKTPEIVFGHEYWNGKYVYFIQDNGVGFDMSYSDKLFKAFEKLHGPEEFDGLGFGLAVAERIISRHGGVLEARSAPGQGATFYFSL